MEGGAAASSSAATSFPNLSKGPSGVTSKLAELQDRFIGYEKQIEQEARTRHDVEESRMLSIRDTILKLEKTLNSEIKRRVESNKSLQTLFENKISTVQEQIENVFLEKIDQLHSTVGSLNDRLTVIEKEFARERERYISDLNKNNSQVAKDLVIVKEAFDKETKARAEREAMITQRLSQHEQRTAANMEIERTTREEKIRQLKEVLKDAQRQRELGDEKFQTFVLEEIATMKNGLVMESQTREASDDDIVQALNHYTKALQDALRIANSS